MGLEAVIQTEPLSLLGCNEQQQGWTWSDGAVPAKHFGTCRDMKGSNETHFTIHWPRALSRQRFLPNIPAIYTTAQVWDRVSYQHTKARTFSSFFGSNGLEASVRSFALKRQETFPTADLSQGLLEPSRDLKCMLILPLVEESGSFIVKSLFFLIVRDCRCALACSDPINISPQHQPL